jgi:hypothetical protein
VRPRGGPRQGELERRRPRGVRHQRHQEDLPVPKINSIV